MGLVGCRLPSRDGPVSRSLLNCRQLSQRGISALEREDWATAEQLLAKAVQTCAADAEARRHYAEALWQRGRRHEAVAQLDEANRLAGDDPSLLVRAAEMRLVLGQFDSALHGVELAIDLNPKLAAAWALRGRILRRAGQLRQALGDYQRSLGYEPQQRQVLLETAELYRQIGEPQQALVNLQSLLDTYPPGEAPQQVLYLQGLAFSALGRYGEAAESLIAARDTGHPTPEILVGLAEAKLLAGRHTEARNSARQALALEPNHPASLALLKRIAAGQPGASTNPRR